jgi:ElaB/YqjD/DUF883 family membrane-anchored ribosome-binding protein
MDPKPDALTATPAGDPDNADKPPVVIQQEIDQTRSALTEKLETLEGEIKDTVTSAKETVEETIENVKDTVTETVQTVKRTFDLRYQVEQRPWFMMGLSLTSGFAAGFLLGGRRGGSRWPSLGSHQPRPAAAPHYAEAASSFSAAPADGRQKPGLASRLMDRFSGEVDQIKGMAIAALVGVVRDLAKEALPSMAPRIEEVMNNITTKLGGHPVEGPVLQFPEKRQAEHLEQPEFIGGGSKI